MSTILNKRKLILIIPGMDITLNGSLYKIGQIEGYLNELHVPKNGPYIYEPDERQLPDIFSRLALLDH